MNTERIPLSIQTVVQRRRELVDTIQRLAEHAQLDLMQATSDTSTALVDSDLKELFDSLSELLDLKQTAGFFDDIVQSAFHMQRPVEQLTADYRQLLQELQELQEMREALSNRPRKVPRLLRGWLVRFEELEHRETQMLQDIWNIDVGSID